MFVTRSCALFRLSINFGSGESASESERGDQSLNRSLDSSVGPGGLNSSGGRAGGGGGLNSTSGGEEEEEEAMDRSWSSALRPLDSSDPGSPTTTTKVPVINLTIF